MALVLALADVSDLADLAADPTSLTSTIDQATRVRRPLRPATCRFDWDFLMRRVCSCHEILRGRNGRG
jgi:hypothetical protein